MALCAMTGPVCSSPVGSVCTGTDIACGPVCPWHAVRRMHQDSCRVSPVCLYYAVIGMYRTRERPARVRLYIGNVSMPPRLAPRVSPVCLSPRARYASGTRCHVWTEAPTRREWTPNRPARWYAFMSGT
jgi:hypothetical protein